MTTASSRTSLVHQLLVAEWEHLVRSRSTRRRVLDWNVVPDGEVADPFDPLPQLVAFAGLRGSSAWPAADDATADLVLGALVRRARHDDLAARVVLQRLMPGIAAIATRWSRGVGRAAAFDEALGAAWEAIRTFPIDRRPVRVAFGLLTEVEYRAFRKPLRRKARFEPCDVETELSNAPTVWAPAAAADPAVELAELLDAAAAAGVPDDDLELVRRLGRGESPISIAECHRVTDRTIRNRRREVAARLRVVALAA
jgi:hypothetical protein